MLATPDRFRGKLFPAVPVPFTGDGQLHREGQERYTAYMASQPVGGVAVWAHTGRGLWLSDDQREEVLASWRAAMPAPRLVIAAAGCSPRQRGVDEVFAAAQKMAEQAARLEADAVMAFPPVSFRGHPDQDRLVLRYHSELGGVGLPLILFYLYETAGGISYSPQVLAQLLARPEVVGIKVATLDSVMTFQQIAALLTERFPAKVLITGEDRFLGYSLMCGAESALVGMGAACTALQCELLSSHLAGDSARFLALSRAVDDLGRHTFLPPMEGYVGRMLWCLVHQGVLPAEAAHDPWGPAIGPAEVERLKACLLRLNQLPGS